MLVWVGDHWTWEVRLQYCGVNSVCTVIFQTWCELVLRQFGEDSEVISAVWIEAIFRSLTEDGIEPTVREVLMMLVMTRERGGDEKVAAWEFHGWREFGRTWWCQRAVWVEKCQVLSGLESKSEVRVSRLRFEFGEFVCWECGEDGFFF